MSAVILDGAARAKEWNGALAAEVRRMVATPGARPPGLAVVLVGSDPASQVYVRRKGQVAERLGFHHRQVDLPGDSSIAAIRAAVDELNADDAIDGILVQLPLPGGLDGREVTEGIDPAKDVDGLTTANAGALSQGRPRLVPCTPAGVMRLLREAGVALDGLPAVVLGRSNLFGRPMAQLLEQANATVTVAHSRTRDLPGVVRGAELVIAAVGRAELVRGDWVRDGAVVVDVGINRLPDGTITGDVAFAEVAPHARAITPVPGGVGPTTIAMLMHNTFAAASARRGGSAA
ncbi:MAG: bifunctional 5,10-methylenetetrahydrofolate dehydrogenase/5,10-methenyltetrahydrofolate cyclohydrolase [Myxococcota bacterium]